VTDASTSQLNWIKASRSYDCGECIELADDGDSVLVRDSKDPSGPRLRFTRRELAAFVHAAGAGEFDQLL
jgi:hypothetical protein